MLEALLGLFTPKSSLRPLSVRREDITKQLNLCCTYTNKAMFSFVSIPPPPNLLSISKMLVKEFDWHLIFNLPPSQRAWDFSVITSVNWFGRIREIARDCKSEPSLSVLFLITFPFHIITSYPLFSAFQVL